MANVTMKIYNRKLEQCLFNLGCQWLACEKDDEGMTYWVFPVNDKTKQIRAWFMESVRKAREEDKYA